MGLDDYTPDLDSGADWGWQTAETQQEKVSEKFKESVKRGSAGIKRTKKDEKKARSKDFLLANFLVKIILDTRYNPIMDSMFAAMDKGYPSNIILGIVSLVHIDVSHAIREISWKPCITFEYENDQQLMFDDTHIDEAIKTRMNQWVEDMIDVVTHDYSSLLTQKIQEQWRRDDTLLEFGSQVFRFFLEQNNISIQEQKSYSIADFILGEVFQAIVSLETQDI